MRLRAHFFCHEGQPLREYPGYPGYPGYWFVGELEFRHFKEADSECR